MIQLFSVLADIQTDFGALTDESLKRAGLALEPPQKTEKRIGVVHNLEARQMWALAQLYQYQALQLLSHSKFLADSTDQAKNDLLRANRAKAFAGFCRELFWLQVQEDSNWTDSPDASCNLSLRSGWTLVKSPAQPQLPAIFKQIIGGGDDE